MKRTHLFLGSIVAAGIIEGFWFYPMLPEQMAVHFGSGGVADGWGAKDDFFKAMGIVLAILAALCGPSR